MTPVQIILFSFGFVLVGVGIYFHSKDKKSGTFIGAGSVLFMVAALNPASLIQMGAWTEFEPNQNTSSVTPSAMVKPVPSKARPSETTTVEPVAKIGEKTKNFIKTVSKRPKKERTAADFLLLGTQAWQEKDFSRAFQHVSHGLAMDSDVRVRSSLIMLQGSLYEAIGNRKDSEANYNKAVSIDPGYNWPYIKLGNLYTGTKQYEKAERAYKRAIELDPNDAWTHNNLGVLYSNQKRYIEAEQAYRTAIKLNPKDAWTHNNLGVLYKDLNRYQEAERAYNQAVALDPQHSLAHNNLAILNRIKQGRISLN